MTREHWYKHKDHGFMLRQDTGAGWQIVVTSLCLHTAEVESDPLLWEAHKRRLRVNGGCGALAVDFMATGEHNPAFKPCRKVPAHIRADFIRAAL